MTNPPASSEEIDKFVPPDILKGNVGFDDFAAMFYYFRDMMNYNSRLFLIFAKKKRSKPILINDEMCYVDDVPLPNDIMDKMYERGMISMNRELVSVLMSTKSKELIHIDKEFLSVAHHTFFTRHFKDTFEKQIDDGVIVENDRNFLIMSICIGDMLYKSEMYIKEHYSRGYIRLAYRVQTYLLGFAHEEELINKFEYARQSFAYYNTELPKLLKFINANLEMILTDVGDPKLLRLLEEDREKDKYHFISCKETLLRMKFKRKEALEAELQRLDAEIKSIESEQ